MSTTQPIRDREELQRFKNYYLLDKPNYRNYALIITGLNTALRINDILHLTWDMVFDDGNIRKHIELKEQKTGKTNRILLNAGACARSWYSIDPNSMHNIPNGGPICSSASAGQEIPCPDTRLTG